MVKGQREARLFLRHHRAKTRQVGVSALLESGTVAFRALRFVQCNMKAFTARGTAVVTASHVNQRSGQNPVAASSEGADASCLAVFRLPVGRKDARSRWSGRDGTSMSLSPYRPLVARMDSRAEGRCTVGSRVANAAAKRFVCQPRIRVTCGIGLAVRRPHLGPLHA